jgi:copper chaperone CopZ
MSATETVDLSIEGMKCDGCARSIQAALSHTEGVLNASVSLPGKSAHVEFSPQKISVDQLAAVVQKAGYKITSR